jgi:tight adherence protein C
VTANVTATTAEQMPSDRARDVRARIHAEARAGAALESLPGRISLEPLSGFADCVDIALQRGTTLADGLPAQAGDVREAGRCRWCLILPVTVLFALYPGLSSVSVLTR